ncbi:MAG: pentapeptide repeat-containing protein [Propionibacteriaceae bacterium]
MARTPRPDFQVSPRLGEDLTVFDDAITDDLVVSARTLSGRGLGGSVAHLVDLEECRWERSSLADAHLTKLTATDQIFDNCDLALLKAPDASVTRAVLTQCRLSGVTMTGATLQHVEVTDAVADFAGFRFGRFKQVRFERCRLTNADFSGVTFDQVVFRDCDLTEAEFHQARVSSAWFINCRWDRSAGAESLRGATIAQSNPMDHLALLAQLAHALGIKLADPDDLPA